MNAGAAHSHSKRARFFDHGIINQHLYQAQIYSSTIIYLYNSKILNISGNTGIMITVLHGP